MLDDDPNYVPFGDVARKRLNQQAQYARHWLTDPELGKGIRWRGDHIFYHQLQIHKDDVETFVTRVTEWRKKTGQIA
jgi:hypothetical protein